MADPTPELIERLCENCTCADNVDQVWTSPTTSEGDFDRCDSCQAAEALEAAQKTGEEVAAKLRQVESAYEILKDECDYYKAQAARLTDDR